MMKENVEANEKLRFVLSAKFGLIVIMFLMPFINISCVEVVVSSLPGMDLVTGTTIETRHPISGKIKEVKFPAQPYAALALGAAVLGLLVGFVKARPARIINAIMGCAGAVFLLLLKSKIDKEVLKEGVVFVTYDVGFSIALILFALAVAASICAASSEAKLE